MYRKKSRLILYIICFVFLLCFCIGGLFFLTRPSYQLKQMHAQLQDSILGSSDWSLRYQLDDGSYVSSTGVVRVDKYGNRHILGNHMLLKENQIQLRTEVDAYIEDDVLYLNQNGVWRAYSSVKGLFDASWWNHMLSDTKPLNHAYERSVTYSGQDVKDVFSHLYLFSTKSLEMDGSEVQLDISSKSLLYSYRPSKLQVSFSDDKHPLFIRDATGVQKVVNLQFHLSFSDAYVSKINIPSECKKIKISELSDLIGFQNFRKKTSHILTQDKWSSGFYVHSLYDKQSVSDSGLLTIQNQSGKDGIPRIRLSFDKGIFGYADVQKRKENALDSLHEQGLSGIRVDDVTQSTVSEFPCYWYRMEYTDESQGFVGTEYICYVSLDDSRSLLIRCDAQVDRASTSEFSVSDFMDILSYVWVESEE